MELFKHFPSYVIRSQLGFDRGTAVLGNSLKVLKKFQAELFTSNLDERRIFSIWILYSYNRRE